MLAERFPYAPRAALPYRHPERRKKRRQSHCHTSLPRMGKVDRVSGARVLSYAEQMRRAFPYTTSCLSYHSHPIRPCGTPSPTGEGCDTRLPSSKQSAHHPCEPIRSPSTVIPSAAEGSLLHCRHMHTCPLTQTTPWCFLSRLSFTHGLPVCRKDPSTSVGMTFKEDG